MIINCNMTQPKLFGYSCSSVAGLTMDPGYEPWVKREKIKGTSVLALQLIHLATPSSYTGRLERENIQLRQYGWKNISSAFLPYFVDDVALL